MSNSSPRVFGVGDVTVCMSTEGLKLYIGHIEIEYIKQINIKFENGKPQVNVSFFTSHDSEISKSIEEMVRTVKALPWVRITP